MRKERAPWSTWRARSRSRALTIGIEEEFMLVDPFDWSLAFRSDDVFAALPHSLRDRSSVETHAAVMELKTGVHRHVTDAVAELAGLRRTLAGALAGQGLRAAVAGTHPTALWGDTVVSSDERYRSVDDSMRVLARREPTLATHIHIGVSSAEDGVRLMNRMRPHLPLLLALSANSPFWQGRATGFASTRTTLFGAFPRTGVPRVFAGYADWARSVGPLIGSGAIADPSFLWWDIRLQPRYGTVEIRIMDAQTTVEDVAALAALVQSLAHLELARPALRGNDRPAVEVIEENRFLAARDGMDARLIDQGLAGRVTAIAELERTLTACQPHAEWLGCSSELDGLHSLAAANGASRQLDDARDGDLATVTAALSRAYSSEQPAPVASARPPLFEAVFS
jgi:carboxylate-amine ligase